MEGVQNGIKEANVSMENLSQEDQLPKEMTQPVVNIIPVQSTNWDDIASAELGDASDSMVEETQVSEAAYSVTPLIVQPQSNTTSGIRLLLQKPTTLCVNGKKVGSGLGNNTSATNKKNSIGTGTKQRTSFIKHSKQRSSKW